MIIKNMSKKWSKHKYGVYCPWTIWIYKSELNKITTEDWLDKNLKGSYRFKLYSKDLSLILITCEEEEDALKVASYLGLTP